MTQDKLSLHCYTPLDLKRLAIISRMVVCLAQTFFCVPYTAYQINDFIESLICIRKVRTGWELCNVDTLHIKCANINTRVTDRYNEQVSM